MEDRRDLDPAGRERGRIPLYEELTASGMIFLKPPHDEPWERLMSGLDPDGYSARIAQARMAPSLTQNDSSGHDITPPAGH